MNKGCLIALALLTSSMIETDIHARRRRNDSEYKTPRRGRSRGQRTGLGILGGGASGALIGGIAGGARGAGIGAVVGVVTGGLIGATRNDKDAPSTPPDNAAPYYKKDATYENSEHQYNKLQPDKKTQKTNNLNPKNKQKKALSEKTTKSSHQKKEKQNKKASKKKNSRKKALRKKEDTNFTESLAHKDIK